MIFVHTVKKDERWRDAVNGDSRCVLLASITVGMTHTQTRSHEHREACTHLEYPHRKETHTDVWMTAHPSGAVSYGIMPEAAHPVIQLKPSLLKCYQTSFNQRLI